jgi:hypothetical protein
MQLIDGTARIKNVDARQDPTGAGEDVGEAVAALGPVPGASRRSSERRLVRAVGEPQHHGGVGATDERCGALDGRPLAGLGVREAELLFEIAVADLGRPAAGVGLEDPGDGHREVGAEEDAVVALAVIDANDDDANECRTGDAIPPCLRIVAAFTDKPPKGREKNQQR